MVRVYLRVSYGCVGSRFFRVFGFRFALGFRFFLGLGFALGFCFLGLLTIGQGLGFFSVLRSFPVWVYLRVSYGFVGLRFF